MRMAQDFGVGVLDVIDGTPGDDSLTGTGGDDWIRGHEGSDTLTGLGGNDRLEGDSGDDVLKGNGGADDLRGGDGSDLIFGGTGADVLRGGLGDDDMNGGADRDIAWFDDQPGQSSGVTVDLNSQDIPQDTGQGMDILFSIEGLRGGSFADTLIGDERANYLAGGGAAGGTDHLEGNGGDDVFAASPLTGDTSIDGGSGRDTLEFSGLNTELVGVTFDLGAAGAHQILAGVTIEATDIEGLSGTRFADHFTGDDAANLLYGGAGKDLLEGGAGRDYLAGDQVVGPWDDTTDMKGGRDSLDGGAGADTLYGGGGRDHLAGGIGADVFLFKAVADSAFGAADLISDLHAQDVIDLSQIDADVNTAGDQAFTLVSAFSGHAGELVVGYEKSSGATIILGDVNGDGMADLEIDASGQHTGYANFVL